MSSEINTKIYAVMIYFEEEYWLETSLAMLQHMVDHIILVDGAYEGYVNPTARRDMMSCDLSNQIIRKFQGAHPDTEYTWITRHTLYDAIHKKEGMKAHKIIKQGWKNEMVKRTYAIDLVPEGHPFVIVDADELLLGDPGLFRKQISYNPPDSQEIVQNLGVIHHPAYEAWFIMPRVYWKKEGMHYEASHANIFWGKNAISWDKPWNQSRVFRSAMLIHMADFYPNRQQQILKWNYIAKRQEEEDISQWKRHKLEEQLKITPSRIKNIEDMLRTKRATGVGYTTHPVED